MDNYQAEANKVLYLKVHEYFNSKEVKVEGEEDVKIIRYLSFKTEFVYDSISIKQLLSGEKLNAKFNGHTNVLREKLYSFQNDSFTIEGECSITYVKDEDQFVIDEIEKLCLNRNAINQFKSDL